MRDIAIAKHVGSGELFLGRDRSDGKQDAALLVDVGTGQVRQRYKMHFKQRNNWITSAAFSSDGKTVVTSFGRGKLLL